MRRDEYKKNGKVYIFTHRPIDDPNKDLESRDAVSLARDYEYHAYSTDANAGFVYTKGTPHVGDTAYMVIPVTITEVSDTHAYPFTGSVKVDLKSDKTYNRNGYNDFKAVDTSDQ